MYKNPKKSWKKINKRFTERKYKTDSIDDDGNAKAEWLEIQFSNFEGL